MDNSLFVKLSPELRNTIYRFAVGSDKVLMVAPTPHKDSVSYDELVSRAVQPAITRVCKQTRSESLLMFYAINDFTISLSDGNEDCMNPGIYPNYEPADVYEQALSVAMAWLKATPPACHAALGCLKVKITLECEWLDHHIPEAAAERLAEGVKQYGYSNGRVSVMFDWWDVDGWITDDEDFEEKIRGSFRDQ